ncbi:VaFE repeat-containing surface-anchored protein [Pauljensenia sp. UMB6358]|uniref:VaFE repeat-containing surface-anchored protein n=1 Tax=Pauljensenia sp. UMB6358 TaxID=3046335 RepID=UPI002550515B|nr:VaFE repeat-containing surface-anchored protein [Pauljensenia sp. UMB6358]MDK7123085.1 VaFE repeat-containing surface-anchored protein [Pauljensenia sp. UMB6358]
MSIPITTHAQDAPRATKGGLAYRLALALTALALIFVGSLSALPAHAAGSWVRGVPIGGSVGWLGTWIPYQGQPTPGLCIQADAVNPSAAVAVTPGELTSQPGLSRPADLSVDIAQMAYIMKWYTPKSLEFSNTDVDAAATGFLAHVNFENSGRAQANVNELLQLTPANVQNRARQMVAEAKAAGVVGWEAGEPETTNHMYGTLDGIRLVNGNGAAAAGYPFTVTLNGPAVFDATGTNTYSGTTASTPITGLKWHSTGNGKVTASVNFTNIISPVLGYASPGGGRQDVIYDVGRLTGKTVQSPTWDVIFDFRPQGLSNVDTAKVIDSGAELTDTFTPNADPNYGDGKWLNIDGTNVPVNYRASLYYIDPLAPAGQSATVPEGAELIKSVIVKANGPETVLTVSAGAAPKDGFYTWVWEVKADDQDAEWSKYIKADFVDDYGMADETTSVRHPAQIDSKLSVRDTKAGTYLVDDVFVTGMPSDHPNFEGAAGFKADEKLISHEVLFFPAGLKVTEANRDKAEKIGQTVTIPAKNGVYPSVGDTSWIAKRGADGKLVAGTYVFISTFAGDDRVTPLATSVEDVTEQFTITADGPKLKTTFTGENGEKTLKPGKDTKLVDKVCDANEKLVPGTEYTLRLKVHNKTTGKMVMVDGTEYEATAKFTPNTPQDCGKVVANLDTTGMANTELVAFEYVYDANGQLVGTHTDAGDADQTIKLAAADNSGGGSALAKTGANLAPLGVAALLATGGAGALVAKRRKN